jgi:hypothetical protein
MTALLNIQLGYLGIGDEADSILDGQYESKPGTLVVGSGPSLVHFGHCKGITQDLASAAMEAAFLSIPMRTGDNHTNNDKKALTANS